MKEKRGGRARNEPQLYHGERAEGQPCRNCGARFPFVLTGFRNQLQVKRRSAACHPQSPSSLQRRGAAGRAAAPALTHTSHQKPNTQQFDFLHRFYRFLNGLLLKTVYFINIFLFFSFLSEPVGLIRAEYKIKPNLFQQRCSSSCVCLGFFQPL